MKRKSVFVSSRTLWGNTKRIDASNAFDINVNIYINHNINSNIIGKIRRRMRGSIVGKTIPVRAAEPATETTETALVTDMTLTSVRLILNLVSSVSTALSIELRVIS